MLEQVKCHVFSLRIDVSKLLCEIGGPVQTVHHSSSHHQTSHRTDSLDSHDYDNLSAGDRKKYDDRGDQPGYLITPGQIGTGGRDGGGTPGQLGVSARDRYPAGPGDFGGAGSRQGQGTGRDGDGRQGYQGR